MNNEDALICPLKVTEAIKFDLKSFRRKMPDDFEGEHTYNAVIVFLIREYERFHDPKRKVEIQKEIDRKYIPLEDYRDEIKRCRESNQQLKKELEGWNDKLQALEDKGSDAESTVEQQLVTISGLQNNISYKDKEISIEKSSVDKLTEKQTHLQESFNNIQYSYNMLADKYNKFQQEVDDFYYQLKALETLYFIGRYLKRYPKRLFTEEKIYDKLHWKDNIPIMLIEDIRYALSLNRYKVLPVRRVDTPNGIAYQYDKRYLH